MYEEDEYKCHHGWAVCVDDVIKMSGEGLNKETLLAAYGVDVCPVCGENIKHMDAVRIEVFKLLCRGK